MNHVDFDGVDMDGRICTYISCLFSASFFCWTSKNSISFNVTLNNHQVVNSSGKETKTPIALFSSASLKTCFLKKSNL